MDRERERERELSHIHISEPTRPYQKAYGVFCVKKKKNRSRQGQNEESEENEQEIYRRSQNTSKRK